MRGINRNTLEKNGYKRSMFLYAVEVERSDSRVRR